MPDTDPEELRAEWEAGEDTGLRPQRVQALRDELMAVTGEYIPRRIPEIESLILDHDQKRGVITRKLREAVAAESEDVAAADPSADSEADDEDGGSD